MCFFSELSKHDRCSSLSGTYVTRCWIITHPTSEVFLETTEILRLYEYSCSNRNFFCIVISPRSDGIKTIFLRMTKKGFKEIQSLKLEMKRKYPSSKTVQSICLAHSVMHSDTAFYYQIPCAFSQEPCTFRDYRIPDRDISKIRQVVSLGNYTTW